MYDQYPIPRSPMIGIAANHPSPHSTAPAVCTPTLPSPIRSLAASITPFIAGVKQMKISATMPMNITTAINPYAMPSSFFMLVSSSSAQLCPAAGKESFGFCICTILYAGERVAPPPPLSPPPLSPCPMIPIVCEPPGFLQVIEATVGEAEGSTHCRGGKIPHSFSFVHP